jgi:hypothetical protein
VIVENGIGVRSSMSKDTLVVPLAAAAWTGAPLEKPAEGEKKAAS